MMRLDGKTVLLTGASGGLGASMARVLSAQGARLVLSGTRAPALEALQASLPGESFVVPCALDRMEDVQTLWERAEQVAGEPGVDILVNNAGITADTLMMRMKDEDWARVIQVNLTSAFVLCRSACKAMIRKRKGRIVNITSVVAFTGNPGQANYTASKAGLGGLSRSLAHEVASRGVTVNCVAPGFIASPMTDVLNEPQKKAILDKIPAGRMGTGEDVAAAVLFLVSDAGSYITGQTIHVNGGMMMT
jgi:3-oxoacyl-[acyl-carrier protein] reductase